MKRLLLFLFLIPTIAQAQSFVWPVLDGDGNLNERVTQEYANYYTARVNGSPLNKYHAGVDVGAEPQGAQDNIIRATASGTIHDLRYVETSTWGNAVMIDHGGGLYSLYAHLDSFSQTWSVGDLVNQGQQLGTMGKTGFATGEHLHFEIKTNDSFGSGYTFDIPDGYGYQDPKTYLQPYSESDITPTVVRVTTSSNLDVRSGPSISYSILTQLTPDQKFVAYKENADWYKIYIPNAGGPVSGWSISNDALIEETLFDHIKVNNTEGVGLNVRTGPGVSYSRVRTKNDSTNVKIWDEQRYVIIDESIVEGTTWYEIDIPTLAQESSGWISGDWVTVEETLIPTLNITPESGKQDEITFNYTGSNYTVNGTVNRFIRLPGEDEFIQIEDPVYADGSGNVSWEYPSSCEDPVGESELYTVDVSSEEQSNTVIQNILSNSECNEDGQIILYVDPSNVLDFGEVEIGESKTLSLTIENDEGSTGHLNVEPGIPSEEFTVIHGASLQLQPGSDYIFEVKFTPAEGREYNEEWNLEHNATNTSNPLVITLKGIGVSNEPEPTPSLTCSESSISFGEVNIDENSPPQSYILTGSDLTSNVSISTPEGFKISLQSDSGYQNSVELAPENGSVDRTVFVRFSPASEQSYEGEIINTSENTSCIINVEGIGTDVDNPLAPSLYIPFDSEYEISTKPMLSWSSSEEATSYHLEVSSNQEFNSFVLNEEGITDTTFQLNNIANNTVHYWRVKALNDQNSSDWSNIWSFTTVDESEVKWIFQESGTEYHLHDVTFIDNLKGWAVGDSGTILHTTNGGLNWNKQISNTEEDLFGVDFINQETGWIVGNNGLILKTVNSGADWFIQNSETSSTLSALSIVDDESGWTVGSNGTILKTIDGGANWTNQDSPAWLRGVHFVDKQIGYAVGHSSIILKTVDGGSNWNTQENEDFQVYRDVYFLDHQIGWLVGNEGIIYKTTDGGSNWLPQESGISQFLFGVNFISSQIGWAVGFNGSILKTSNSGASWINQNSITENNLRSVFIIDSETGWAVGSNGTILKYTSESENKTPASIKPVSDQSIYSLDTTFWVEVKVGDPEEITNLYGVSFKLKCSVEECIYVENSAEKGSFLGDDVLDLFTKVDDQTVDIAVTKKSGEGVNGEGVVARAKFVTSTSLQTPVDIWFMLEDVIAINPEGEEILFETSELMVNITEGIPVWPGDTNNDSLVTSADILPLGTYYGETGSVQDNPGITWQSYIRSPWPQDEGTPRRVYADANGDSVIDGRDILPIGINYGKTPTESVSENELAKTNSIDDTNIILDAEIINKATTNQDSLIVGLNVKTPSPLYGIAFKVNYNLEGSENSIKSTNIDLSSGVFSDELTFYEIIEEEKFIDVGLSFSEQEGFVGGGELLRMAFELESFPKDYKQIVIDYRDVVANDKQGNALTVETKPSNLIVTNFEDLHETPQEYTLHQNYPNPFNPSTNISFSIPEYSKVTIKVYNLLGREISTITDGWLSAGHHTVEWNLQNQSLSSGLYIYKMTAEPKFGHTSFVKVKSMVLMK